MIQDYTVQRLYGRFGVVTYFVHKAPNSTVVGDI